MKSFLISLAALLSLAMSALSAAMYWSMYWRWRGCFDEQGRCFDPETATVHLEQSGIAWGALTLLCLTFALGLLWLKSRA